MISWLGSDTVCSKKSAARCLLSYISFTKCPGKFLLKSIVAFGVK